MGGGRCVQGSWGYCPDGIQAAYVGEFALAGKEYGEAPWYRETLKNGYYVSDVFLGYRNVPHFVVAVTRRIGEKMWVLRATINSQVFRQLVEKVSIGDTGEAYILDRKGFFRRCVGLVENCSKGMFTNTRSRRTAS